MRRTSRAWIVSGLLGLGLLACGDEAGAQWSTTYVRGTDGAVYKTKWQPLRKRFKTTVVSPAYTTTTYAAAPAGSVVQETRIIRPAPVVQRTFIRPAPIVQRTYVQPAPVVQRTFVQPPPVEVDRVVQPPAVPVDRVVQPPTVEVDRVVQPPTEVETEPAPE